MRSILVLAIIAALVPGYWTACKTVEELDQCAYEVSFLANRNLKPPTNDAEVVDQCNKAKAGLKCLSDQAKECMKGALKSLTVKVMGDLEKHLNTHCDSPPHRAEFLKHVQCFQDQAKADAIRLCSDKHMVMLEKVSNMPKELKLGGACCSSHALRECILGKITTLCSGESGDYFNELINEVAEENIELVCQQYSTLDQCNSKYDAGTWNDLKAIMASEDAAMVKNHKFKTIVPIVVKMLRESGRR